jgi:hypothetical protein|tara:strand:+ start:491 stop:673 length:183 start_codon:yes stop_codon:yes gene_type:complete
MLDQAVAELVLITTVTAEQLHHLLLELELLTLAVAEAQVETLMDLHVLDQTDTAEVVVQE